MEFIGLKGGLIMSGIAFSIVFIVIIALMFIMMASSTIAKSFAKKKKPQLQEETTTAAKPTTITTNNADSDAANDDIIAAIVGAVMASAGTNMRICSIKEAKQGLTRLPSASVWKIAARTMNHENCF